MKVIISNLRNCCVSYLTLISLLTENGDLWGIQVKGLVLDAEMTEFDIFNIEFTWRIYSYRLDKLLKATFMKPPFQL